MSFLGRPGLPLKKLWEERSSSSEFKRRNTAYQVQRNAYLSRSPSGERANVTWRPVMLDGEFTADQEHQEALNLAKQIGLHHQSSFARPPRVWNLPHNSDQQGLSDRNTSLIGSVLRASRIKLVQGQQSHNLAVLGDACYGVFYDQARDARRRLWIRGVDPGNCYPAVDDDDPGRLWDNLVTYEVKRSWAEKQYGISLGESASTVRIFEYWDDEWRLIDIEERHLPEPWSFQHKLGFTPWRWCYCQDSGKMGQADISETPKIQELLNDLLVLALDATRRNIDKSYIGIGVKGTLSPQPGKILGIPNPQASVSALDTAVPPAMLIQVMQMLQGHAESMAGISPISMEGLAEGSVVTGSAVRHQVEAIEARMETKRARLEDVYAWLGESILRVWAQKFKSVEMPLLMSGGDVVGHKGSDVGDWYQCEAAYGSFDGLPADQRGNWAMQGLGRLHGRRTAISLAYPDQDVMAMEREIDDYQVDQAVVSAKAQQAAQAVLSSGSQPAAGQGAPSPGPGAGVAQGGAMPAPIPSQPKQTPPQPGMAMLGGAISTISDLKLLVRLVQDQLQGDAYATGEMAITGMAAMPEVSVTEEHDRGLVAGAVQARRATVKVGVREDEPRVLLNG